ncbi:HTH-type transcriptional regulator LysM [Candidatus Nitrosocaldus cavascurensis]|jgi:DNA-binding Lrp family transcriptional regulator|uniref:HTH-type transcriptional regulator LysM n=1 Tax=Candidatus Nitrosocaldus cavascurensis TaxID=2058097 RepID=A0A2K5AS04_9ARCH|nr:MULTISPECIES: HTH-type transcriptional regulator LysM [Candidatus Nitrosocaldus]SPC34415.1 HTH-type transcriptional regulator LysM [Candidatus Nitrosocaldus cavascurensis]
MIGERRGRDSSSNNNGSSSNNKHHHTIAIDSIDERIIGILKEDSRRSYVEIAKAVGLSESAVRRRIKHLIDSGIIKRFTIELGMSNKTSAITLISVKPSVDTAKVSERLKGLRGVEVVYEITGQYDIAAIISASSIGEINRCIDDVRRIEGVDDTNTVIILRVVT